MSNSNINSQKISLKITSKNKKEALVLDKLKYQEQHKDSASLHAEILKASRYLKNIGYFTNTVDEIKKVENENIVFFTLRDKIENVILKINSESQDYFEKTTKNTISIPIKNLEKTLSQISDKLNNEGRSFSTVQLKNINIQGKTLFSDLLINKSTKRTINKVIVKEYERFSKPYLKHYLNINQNTIINKQKLKVISKVSKTIPFITEIKPPEVLFTKDSTLLYLYFKKKQNNSFDANIGFTSKEDGTILFNGNVDLSLKNILDTGEKIELFWNSIGEEQQEFKISSENPYVFNTKFSPQISFSIYKQDSSFVSSKFDSKLFYNINPKTKFALTYNSEASENLQTNLGNNIESFGNNFFGLQFQYRIPKNDFFLNSKFNLEINPTFGKRKNKDKNENLNQFKIETSLSYILDINSRSSISIKNKIGYLNSDTFINNELFRIGGVNTIRGFNEQSIITNDFNIFKIEFRYLTSEKTYFYTITDAGRIKLDSKNKNLLGLGLGYLFTTKKARVNISLAKNNQNTDLKEINFTVKWTNFF